MTISLPLEDQSSSLCIAIDFILDSCVQPSTGPALIWPFFFVYEHFFASLCLSCLSIKLFMPYLRLHAVSKARSHVLE